MSGSSFGGPAPSVAQAGQIAERRRREFVGAVHGTRMPAPCASRRVVEEPGMTLLRRRGFPRRLIGPRVQAQRSDHLRTQHDVDEVVERH